MPPPPRSLRAVVPAATLAAICMVAAFVCLGGARPGQVFAAAVASLQLAGAALMWVRGRRPAAWVGWPVLGGAVALAICLAVPRAIPAVGALARLSVYASLLGLFARSLRPGQEPVATALARRIHPVLTQDRLAYTRGVTWLWTTVFAAQLAFWSMLLAMAPFRREPWFVSWADLPLLAVLLVGEMAVRAIKFRGQPHGSFRDMLRAGRRV